MSWPACWCCIMHPVRAISRQSRGRERNNVTKGVFGIVRPVRQRYGFFGRTPLSWATMQGPSGRCASSPQRPGAWHLAHSYHTSSSEILYRTCRIDETCHLRRALGHRGEAEIAGGVECCRTVSCPSQLERARVGGRGRCAPYNEGSRHTELRSLVAPGSMRALRAAVHDLGSRIRVAGLDVGSTPPVAHHLIPSLAPHARWKMQDASCELPERGTHHHSGAVCSRVGKSDRKGSRDAR